jgi:hypothetical protein
MKSIIVLLFSLLAFGTQAQNTYCPTKLSQEQLQWLRQFQSQIDTKGLPQQAAVITYVPVKFHIIGNNEGKGYYTVSALLRAFCDLNEDFLPSGLQFYLADSISYINDDELYTGNSDAIWFRSEDYKKEDAVNVFFHGAGMQWCGVYFPGVDVVFVKNSCQGSAATTLTHELGHFFSLPHTFSGWEGGNDPGVWERLDGANCRNAGDGFCDTKADYVSQRWGCPLPWTLKDQTGASFKPDSSIYMSYSSDQCQSRFSQEQMAAMRANVSSRGISTLTADIRELPAPKLLTPRNLEANILPNQVNFAWRKVQGAFAYHFQVARFGDWNYINYDVLVYDTSTVLDLFGSWEYTWRVKAITNAYTCSDFGASDTFYTKETASGLVQTETKNLLSIYPNPANGSQFINLLAVEVCDIEIRDAQSRLIQSFRLEPKRLQQITLNESGLYLIYCKQSEKVSVRKLLVD